MKGVWLELFADVEPLMSGINYIKQTKPDVSKAFEPSAAVGGADNRRT